MTERMTAADLIAAQGKGPRVDREGPIHKSILEYVLTVLPRRAVVHHSPNELNMAGDAKSRAIAISKAKALGMVPGWPDLEIMIDGQAYFLEIKAESGTVSKDQIAVISRLRVAGCRIQVVNSIDGARRALQEWGLIP